jgi:hypothetical protein
MHSPTVAQTLRERGHDVVAVAESTDLRSMSDEEVFLWSAERARRIVTENVKDHRRLLMSAEEAGRVCATLLYTSSRTFPRSGRNPGPLIAALAAWMEQPDAAARAGEDWLRPVSTAPG